MGWVPKVVLCLRPQRRVAEGARATDGNPAAEAVPSQNQPKATRSSQHQPTSASTPGLRCLDATSPPGPTPASQIDGAALALGLQLLAWRRDFHQHPELGNREFRTAAVVAEYLHSADMDALPVVEQVNLPFSSKARAS